MPRIIDMECSVPYGANVEKKPAAAPAEAAAGATEPKPAGYGMANYGRIFRARREGADHRPDEELEAYVEKLGKLGIVRSVPFGISNEEQAQLLRRFPRRFLGLARISITPLHGMSGGRELERLVRVDGFCGLGISRLVDWLPASDRRCYPAYPNAAQRGSAGR